MRNARVSKKQFLADVARRCGIHEQIVIEVYDAIVDNMFDELAKGHNVSLAGFGLFYAQKHKGHPVQFNSDKGKTVDDYFVLKFSASKNSNRRLREKNII